MRRLPIVAVLVVGCGGDDGDGDGDGDGRFGRRADLERLIEGLAGVIAQANPGAHLGDVVHRECGEACACLAHGASVACPESGGPVRGARWNAMVVAGKYLAEQVERAPADRRDDLLRAIIAVRIAIPHAYRPTSNATRVTGGRAIGPAARHVTIHVDNMVVGGVLPSARFTADGVGLDLDAALTTGDPLARAAERAAAADLIAERRLAIDQLPPGERMRYLGIQALRPPAAYEVVAVARPSTRRDVLAIADPLASADRLIALAHESRDPVAIAVHSDRNLRELALVFVKDHAGPAKPLPIEFVAEAGAAFDAVAARKQVRAVVASGAAVADGVDLTVVDLSAGHLIEILDEIVLAGATMVRVSVISSDVHRRRVAGVLGRPPPNAGPRPAIRDAVRKQLSRVTYCYEKQLLVKPDIEGTVTVKFTIEPDGRVSAATATGVDPAVASCVRDVIEAIDFPPMPNSTEVRYPFVFKTGP